MFREPPDNPPTPGAFVAGDWPIFPAMRFALAVLISGLLTPLLAQDALENLVRRFAAEYDRLYAAGSAPTQAQERALVERHRQQMQAFVAGTAQGQERWRGRLMLVEICLQLDDRQGALEALRGIDLADATGPLLLMAANDAGTLGDTDLRTQLMDAAKQRKSTFAERMEMGRLLMTLLTDVAGGEAVFTKAMEDAADDEARARVAWHRCDAIREREDLPENSYYVELDKLVERWPGTYYGGVAKDRLQASQFAIGKKAVDFTRKTTDGAEVSLQSLQGKTVVLAFWAPTEQDNRQLCAMLNELAADADTIVLGISMDEDLATFRTRARELGARFPQIHQGGGWKTDLAVRYHVETAPTLIILDGEGRIRGLNLHIETRDAREQLEAALRRARSR
jgi:peroxiredoxin